MARRRDSTTTTYDWDHQQERTRWAPTVDSGNAHCTEPICLMPSRWIPPGSAWDLAHNRAQGGYRGPAHRRCNRSEGATYGNRRRGLQRVLHSRAW